MKDEKPITKPTYRTEPKTVKHVFTDAEKLSIGAELARAIAAGRDLEEEFDGVKSSYKAKTAEAVARTGALSTALNNGFDMRAEKCVVIYRPRDRKKDYYVDALYNSALAEDALDGIIPALTEDMSADDFQQELVQAESKFDCREELYLFPTTGEDRGIVVVGKFAAKWFAALRVKVGKVVLDERLDSEQRSFKNRIEAIRFSVKGFQTWADENFKKEAKGFQAGCDALLEAQKERAE